MLFVVSREETKTTHLALSFLLLFHLLLLCFCSGSSLPLQYTLCIAITRSPSSGSESSFGDVPLLSWCEVRLRLRGGERGGGEPYRSCGYQEQLVRMEGWE